MKKLLLSLIALATTVTMGFAQTNLVENGGFESWEGNVPTNWKSSTTASSATLAQSTDAHNGSYAVQVKGSDYNKRIAYKEITLKAGTYYVTVYAKAATAEGGAVRPGYVAVLEDGKVDKDHYNYGQYYNNLTADAWTEVKDTIVLEAQTKLNLLVLNPKKPGKDILLDDYSIVTTDGGLVEDGGTVDPTPNPEPTPTPEAEGIFSETFAESLGDFTIDNKVLPEGSDYVWNWAGKNYGAKASSYVNKQKLASEAWLVSPVIDLTGYKDCKLTFSHAANFFNDAETFHAQTAVKVRTEGGEWTDLAYEGEPGYMSWTFVDASASLAAYDGQKIQIAFAYTSTTEVAGTWEIKNFKVDGSKTTGIAGITTDATAPAAIYSIDGRRLAAPVKGINIINGKKVLVK